MNYYRDLLPRNNVSVVNFVLAGIFLYRGIVSVAVRHADHAPMQSGDFALPIGWCMLSMICILQGLGYRHERLPGKAYVQIDDEVFVLKPWWPKKEMSVLWKDVNGIVYSAEKYTMRTRDGRAVMFELTTLDYAVIQEVKAMVEQIAAEKGIEVIRNRAKSVQTDQYTNKELS